MFCPGCGVESAEGLRFCKQCGSSLTSTSNVEYVRPVKITGAVWAIAVMTFLCFVVVFGGVAALAGIGVRNSDILAPIAVFGSFSILGICALMIRMVLRAVSISSQLVGPPNSGNKAIPAPYNQAQIPPAPQGYVPSVTENTTRSFDRQPGESSSH